MEALFALDHKCFPPRIAYSRADLRYFLSRPLSITVAAEDEARALVGFAIAESYLEGGKRVGHIVTIDVEPAVRRQGVGQALMTAMLDGLRKLEAVLVRLEVAVDNGAAQAFYRHHGFRETGRIAGFYMGTLDALTMEKTL